MSLAEWGRIPTTRDASHGDTAVDTSIVTRRTGNQGGALG